MTVRVALTALGPHSRVCKTRKMTVGSAAVNLPLLGITTAWELGAKQPFLGGLSFPHFECVQVCVTMWAQGWG